MGIIMKQGIEYTSDRGLVIKDNIVYHGTDYKRDIIDKIKNIILTYAGTAITDANKTLFINTVAKATNVDIAFDASGKHSYIQFRNFKGTSMAGIGRSYMFSNSYPIVNNDDTDFDNYYLITCKLYKTNGHMQLILTQPSSSAQGTYSTNVSGYTCRAHASTTGLLDNLSSTNERTWSGSLNYMTTDDMIFGVYLDGSVYKTDRIWYNFDGYDNLFT